MAFEIIDNIQKSYSSSVAVPVSGVKVSARALKRMSKAKPSEGGGDAESLNRFIRIEIGVLLAKAISLVADDHRVRVLFGTGSDAGKLQISVDNSGGDFPTKRNKKGNYALTVNAASADGLFALEFPVFTVEKCEAVRPENGQPPHFVFKASVPMLAVPD